MKIGQVESGIEIPEAVKKYPFDKMGIGDSFFVECGEDNRYSVYGRVRSSSNSAGVRLKMKFATRIVNGGFRVWRTK